MEFAQEMKGFCDIEEEEEQPEEEEEEEEEEEIMGETSSSASPMYRGVAPPQQPRMWLGTSESEEAAARSYDRAAPELDSNKGLEFVNLSLRNNDDVDSAGGGGGSSAGGGGRSAGCSSSSAAGGGGGGFVEREHMFDKVVTPSDVGKLNRLVIPKQHAEKYFPLDSSASDKGLLLNFEDREGKPWRFRYSYWNSSQSYVMTKGWSRFVKEKKLDAGDIVSFQRGVGESGKDHLYIDWRRRPDAPDPTSLSRLHLPSHHHLPFSQPFRWGRLYSLPQSLSMSMPQSLSMNMPHFHDHMQQQLNYNSSSLHPYHRHHHHHHQQRSTMGGGVNHDYNAYYLSPSSSAHQNGAVRQGGGSGAPMVIDSVPVVKTTAKRLRLFGVNMECPTPDDRPECNILSSTAIPHVTMSSLSPHLPSSSSSLSPLQLRLCNGSPDEFPKRGKTSLSFDLDI